MFAAFVMNENQNINDHQFTNRLKKNIDDLNVIKKINFFDVNLRSILIRRLDSIIEIKLLKMNHDQQYRS